jgi:hypothetical protein
LYEDKKNQSNEKENSCGGCMKLINRHTYENILNKLGPPPDDDKQNGGRCSSRAYGRWLRINDPVKFGIDYNEWIISQY